MEPPLGGYPVHKHADPDQLDLKVDADSHLPHY